MPKSRLPYLATLGTFLMMAACTPSPVAPNTNVQRTTRTKSTANPDASPTELSTTDPSSSSTATPSATPSATSTATATATPSATGTAATTPTSLAGTVYDEKGSPVASAQVKVTSLSSSFNVSATTDASGNYSIAKPPSGEVLTIVATKTGFTSRQRVETLSANTASTYNFGGPTSTADPTGVSYFISDYPEIVSVTPADQSAGNGATVQTYTLTLSEPLTTTGRNMLQRAVRIWPANAAAAPAGNPAPTLLDASATAQEVDALPMSSEYANGNYALDMGSYFGDVNDFNAALSSSWNIDNTKLTISFKAPLIDSNNAAARYQFGLVHTANTSSMQDSGGNAIGTDASGVPGSAPSTSDSTTDLVHDAFEAPLLSGTTWASTHENVAYFDLSEDNTVPTLLSVMGLKTSNGQSQLELTFNKPMAAYGGNPATNDEYLSSSALDAANYIFLFGTVASDVSNADLKAGTPQTAGSFAQVATGTPTIFASDAVTIQAAPDDPSVLFLTASGTNDHLAASIGALKVRVV
ncbi:MAG TPA: carboxypeptidase-like regulatory domain-containing protein, partial [Oscillatoriaceae cyanobacterium]